MRALRDVKTMQRLKSKQHTFYKNDIFILFIAATLSVLFSSAGLLYIALGLIAIKEAISGSLFQAVFNHAFFIICSLTIILIAGVLLTSSGIAASVLNVGSLVLLLLLGMSYALSKDAEWFVEGLLLVRNVVLTVSVLSVLMEVFLNVRFVTDGSAPPLSIVPIENRESYRLRSIFGHAIVYAQVLLVCLVINAYFERNKILKATIGLFLLCMIFLTKTRGAWIICALMLAYLILKQIKSGKKDAIKYITLFLPVALLLIILVYKFGLIEEIVRRFGQLSTDVSFSQRYGAIHYMLQRFSEKPLFWLFGNGFSSSGEVISRATIEIRHFATVDNGYIAMLYEYGIIGFGLFAGMVCASISEGIYSGDNLSKVLLGINIISCIEMLFYCELGWWVPTVVWFLSTGYLIELRRVRFVTKQNASQLVVAIKSSDLGQKNERYNSCRWFRY